MRTHFKLAAIIVLTYSTQSYAQNFSFTDLGGGAANAINDAGQIAGVNASGQAILWDGTTPTILDTLGHYDDATGINSAGEIVGFDDTGHHQPKYHAVTWDGSTPDVLPTNHSTLSVATGINIYGEEVGFEYHTGDRARQHAVIWDGAQEIVLGTLNNHTYSEATGINNAGQEVGYFYQDNNSGMRQAVLWNGTTPTLLGTLGKNTSTEATAINNNGQEAGYSDAPGYLHRSAVIWNGTTPTALASLGGTNSMALAINNAGDVVGYSYLAGNVSKQAVLWENGKVINLNSELTSAEISAGWVLEDATGINNTGTIVGVAENTFTGKDSAFVLDVIEAVPEPKTYAMFLMGLGLIGFMSRRRKQTNRANIFSTTSQSVDVPGIESAAK